MSGTSTWLHNQRKSDLLEIARDTGLKGHEDYLKAELETALEDHLNANRTRLEADNRKLAPYYKKADNSASRKDSSSSTALVETKTPAKKRVSKAKEDITSAVDDATSAIVRTPAAASAQAKQLIPANVPLPPSPAVVANAIDKQYTRGKSKLNQVIRQSGVSEYTNSIRENASSAAAVQSIALLIEAFGVINETLPRKRIFAIPGVGVLIPEFPVKVNDLFNLLTTDFWAPFSFWLLSAVLVPLLLSFFFNFAFNARAARHATRSTHPAGQFDPLTFSLSKALIQWLIYTQSATAYGWPSIEAKARIEQAVPFGHQGAIVASGVGVIVALYEAVLRK